MDRQGVRSHMYADNTHFYNSCRPSDIDSLRSRLSHCASDTDVWCRSRRLQHLQWPLVVRCRSHRLQLNANKTEAIWFGSKSNLTKLNTANMSVQVGSATIQPSAVVRDLGLHLESRQWAVNETSCRQGGRGLLLPPTTTATDRPTPTRKHGSYNPASLDCRDRLHYCNSLLAGAPLATLGPLQHVQNAAARLIRAHSETISLHVFCRFTGYQYAGASSISCAALCTL